ncbi:hypothetical protein QUF55_06280 [Clostridiaceae bacterium HSG29]|nr:hypothetical protein [Clostridiaceae bacterium HSG29]
MKRKNESNLVSHLLDNLFPSIYGDLSLRKYENLYSKKSYHTNKNKKQDSDEVKCMIINNKLYCENRTH